MPLEKVKIPSLGQAFYDPESEIVVKQYVQYKAGSAWLKVAANIILAASEKKFAGIQFVMNEDHPNYADVVALAAKTQRLLNVPFSVSCVRKPVEAIEELRYYKTDLPLFLG